MFFNAGVCQMMQVSLLVLILPSVLSQCSEYAPMDRQKCEKNWHVGVDSVRPSGTVVHAHASTPGESGTVQGNVHGSHVFGGPNNGAQTVGGGLNYQHSNGMHGEVDATHHRGQGTSYSGSAGGTTKVGPGTLSVDVGVSTNPGSSKVHGQVGATYSVPLP